MVNGKSKGKATRVVTEPYASEACEQCRKVKQKCDGKQPLCFRCRKSGHVCNWGNGTARVALTKRREQSLRHQIETMRSQVKILEDTLASVGLGAPEDQECIQRANESENERETDEYSNSVAEDDISSEGSEVEKLCAATNTLFLENDQFSLYGLTAVFRLSQSHPSYSLRPPRVEPNGSKKHILLLLPEGTTDTDSPVKTHCGCWSHCWSRHLPGYDQVPLTRLEHDRLLALVFIYFTSWCMRIIPEYFLRDMHEILHASASQPPPRLAHYSPFLHNSLMAGATAFSDDPQVSGLSVRQHFATTAKGYIESECERPSLSAVQALAILASFYSGQGQQSLGFMYFGMSIRIAQALGLGTDCAKWAKAGIISTRDVHDRNWCFQMSCAQDACWSLYVGREFGLSAHPINSHPFSSDLVREMDEAGFHWEAWGLPSQPSYIFSTFIASCELLWISRRIMEIMNILSGPNKGPSNNLKLLVTEIDMQLMSWREHLAPELALKIGNNRTAMPHKLMLHLAFWWLVILLHRPFFRRQRVAGINLPFSVDRCQTAAREITKLIFIWRDRYGLRYTPITFIQPVFSAGTVYILTAVQANMGTRPAPDTRSKALDNVQKLIEVLRETGKSWQCASKIADSFESLLQEHSRQPVHGCVRKASVHSNPRAGEPSRTEPLDTTIGVPPQSSQIVLDSADLQGHGCRASVELPTDIETTETPSMSGESVAPSSSGVDVSTPDIFSFDYDGQFGQEPFDWFGMGDVNMTDEFSWGRMGLSMMDGQTFSTQPSVFDSQLYSLNAI